MTHYPGLMNHDQCHITHGPCRLFHIDDPIPKRSLWFGTAPVRDININCGKFSSIGIDIPFGKRGSFYFYMVFNKPFGLVRYSELLVYLDLQTVDIFAKQP